MAAEQVASEGYKAVELVVASGLGAVITLLANGILQALKHKHDKQFTVHELQFKKEFELYEKLWKALVAVRKTVVIGLDIETSDKLSDEKQYEKAVDAFNKAKNLFEDNRPFYHDSVSKLTRELIHQCREHLRKVVKTLKSKKDGDNLSDKAEELLKIVPKAIDDIEKAIKDRIGILQKAEIVD